MKLIYSIFALVPLALANSQIQCPCNIQDCSKAADACVCANQNIVNKYFCCDANTAAPKDDLGLKDCNAQKSPVVNAYIPDATFKGTCRGPYGILCSPDDVCEIFSFKSAEIPHDWGYCWTPGHFGDPDPSITSTVTSTSSVVSTLSGPSSSPSTSSVLSTSTVVQTTTVPPPTLVSVITTSVPFTTIVVKTTTVTPPTLVTVTTTVASTTSTNSDPCAIETAKECVTDEDCYPRFGYSTLHCDHSVECPLAGIDIEGYVCTGLCRPWHCEMP